MASNAETSHGAIERIVDQKRIDSCATCFGADQRHPVAALFQVGVQVVDGAGRHDAFLP